MLVVPSPAPVAPPQLPAAPNAAAAVSPPALPHIHSDVSQMSPVVAVVGDPHIPAAPSPLTHPTHMPQGAAGGALTQYGVLPPGSPYYYGYPPPPPHMIPQQPHAHYQPQASPYYQMPGFYPQSHNTMMPSYAYGYPYGYYAAPAMALPPHPVAPHDARHALLEAGFTEDQAQKAITVLQACQLLVSHGAAPPPATVAAAPAAAVYIPLQHPHSIN